MDVRATSNRIVGIQHSAFHRFLQALADKNVFVDNRVTDAQESLPLLTNHYARQWPHGSSPWDWGMWGDYFDSFTPVVIQHNWDDALGDSIEVLSDDEWRLFGPRLAFEFAVIFNDRGETIRCNAVATLAELEDNPADRKLLFALFLDCVGKNEAWIESARFAHADAAGMLATVREHFLGEPPTMNLTYIGLCYIVLRQIRAACIAVDSGVAEESRVLPPPKKNAARIRSGKIPLPAVSVINLAAKYGQYTRPQHPGGRHVRFHLRRGHWWPRLTNEESRFSEYRHWRPWRFVGDPDLGFIEHEYRI